MQSAVTGVAPGHTTHEMRKGMHTPASPCMRIAESVWDPLEMCSDLGGVRDPRQMEAQEKASACTFCPRPLCSTGIMVPTAAVFWPTGNMCLHTRQIMQSAFIL